MISLQKPEVIGALRRFRLDLPQGEGALALALANGVEGGPGAFAALVHFRDATGALILPPHAGFPEIRHGISGFPVAGGTMEAPAMTAWGWKAPEGAAVMEIELRPGAFAFRPLLVAEPVLTGGRIARQGAGSQQDPPRLRLALKKGAGRQEFTILTANGKPGGEKAFLARLRFLDDQGTELAGSEGDAAETGPIPLAGGAAGLPGRTVLGVTPPATAGFLELTLHPGLYGGKPALASLPVVADAQMAMADLPSGPEGVQDMLRRNLEMPAQGSRIKDEMARACARVLGIFGPRIARELGDRAIDAALPFDRYDRDWTAQRPGYLLIEAEALAGHFGWEHALTLRDPAATVELATMLERARAKGIRTVLIAPGDVSRFPLLSRLEALFDRILPADAPVVLN
ncbi:MAG: hypothetical protein ACK5M4_12425 [Pseudorhodobacter sp.]